jgi:hypothetical protein
MPQNASESYDSNLRDIDTAAGKAIRLIRQQPQAQYGLADQLRQLQGAANKLGLYDAADWLEAHRA